MIGTTVRGIAMGMLLPALAWHAAAAEPAAPHRAAGSTHWRFELPRDATTSAGVYDPTGRLLRTLWRGDAMSAGIHEGSWDGRDDSGAAAVPGDVEIRLVHHRMRYVWEGVVGNSSEDAGGPRMHRAFLPPMSLAISGSRAFYAVGYNEFAPGLHGFDLALPQRDTRPFESSDPFASYSMIAVDATRLYWANTGGLAKTNFVGAFTFESSQRWPFAAGKAVCLNPIMNTAACHAGQDYRGVIDLHTTAEDAPTGLAVQSRGRVLAVAHGGRGLIRLFDKNTGELLREFAVPMAPKALNQLAMTVAGDLWVISGRHVLRFTDLATSPRLSVTASGLVRPIALAASPTDEDGLWVADGGASQQLKRFDRGGHLAETIGSPGGYAADPVVRADRLFFRSRDGLELSALAVSEAGDVWAVDHANNRMLRYRRDTRGSMTNDAQIAYLPGFYSATVDHGNPRHVFANFLEFEVDSERPLHGASSWTLVRNWLGGLPLALADDRAFNAAFGGLTSVETLANGRRYGMVVANGRQVVVELPASGPLRIVKTLGAAMPNATAKVMYENGDLGYAVTSATSQSALRLALTGFDDAGDPTWSREPSMAASVPLLAGSPHYRGAFSGMPPRFPISGSGKVIFFDQSVTANEGFHLGAVRLGERNWLWQASPTGALDGKGSFQTKAIDGSLNYGGNSVWAEGRHIVYGFHGEFYKDLQNGSVGQASQFMHFDDSGLFLGQFGRQTTRASSPLQAGVSGNAFSPTLVRDGPRLYLYHNDESFHGGIHRWRLDGWNDVVDMRGVGPAGSTIVLR